MAEVVRHFGPSYVARMGSTMPLSHLDAMWAFKTCGTEAQGGHVVECVDCQTQGYAYHSCRHRSCPRCMPAAVGRWTATRTSELLPVSYLHIVFSVPRKLSSLIRKHQKTLYPLLMQAAGATLLDLGATYLGGLVGIFTALHTWSRTLSYHPHVHCLVPCGFLDENGQWHGLNQSALAPQKVIAKVFRDRLCAMMLGTIDGLQLPRSIVRKAWSVWASEPKTGAEALLHYMALNAMSDCRIVEVTDSEVAFKYRVPGHTEWRTMRLSGHEFLRRFLQHILPKRIHRFRYFGFWSRKSKPQLAALREQLMAATPTDSSTGGGTGTSLSTPATPPGWLRCPHCSGQRVIVCRFERGTLPPPLRAPQSQFVRAQPP